MHLLSTCTGIPTRLATLLLLALAATAQATMAAWWTDLGPQVILQNDTTGLIQYSACNSKGQPQYSATDKSTFSLDEHKPKKGTPLGGAGWFGSTQTVASIYYLDEENNVVNALFNCNMTTGLFENDGSWIISASTPLPLSPNSGLTAILLGPKAGYRVYYHDENMAVNELGYTTDEGWQYKAVISQDRQGAPAIAAAFSGNANISVVTARDAENIEVSRYQNDSLWRITTFPHPLQDGLTTMETAPDQIKINSAAQANFTLPAWKGKPGALGISIDRNYTRSVWYIGDDRNLYWVANKQWVWSHQNSQQAKMWPVADSPNAPLAVAGDYNGMLRIYYLAGGKLVEIKSDKGEWKEWTALPAPQPVLTSPPPSSSSPAPAPAVQDDSSGGLSKGVKIGLGVGISLAVVAIGAITAALCMLRRKRSTSPSGSEAGAGLGPDTYKPIGSFDSPSTQYSTHGVPPGSVGYDHYGWDMKDNGELVHTPNTAGVFQLDATGRPVELDAPQQRYELSDQSTSHELMGEGPVPIHRPSR